jgi:hypothetical protein
MKPNLQTRFLLALGLTLTGISIGQAATPAAVDPAIPAFVASHPAYQALFKNEAVMLYAEGSLSPTRRYLALENGEDKMLFVVLDLTRQDNRWHVAFVHGVNGLTSGRNSCMTVFHENNRLRVVWQVVRSISDMKLTCLQADEQSSAFGVTEYATGYGSYFWEKTTDPNGA